MSYDKYMLHDTIDVQIKKLIDDYETERNQVFRAAERERLEKAEALFKCAPGLGVAYEKYQKALDERDKELARVAELERGSYHSAWKIANSERDAASAKAAEATKNLHGLVEEHRKVSAQVAKLVALLRDCRPIVARSSGPGWHAILTAIDAALAEVEMKP